MGLRFVVPARALNAGPSRTSLNPVRGLTDDSSTIDSSTGFGGIVVPGTIRDRPFILSGRRNRPTGRDRHLLGPGA